MKLILAQGNPGQKHQNNRHNSGFMVLDDFAKKHQFIWQENARFQAEIAKGKINGQNIILAKPTTFYNETGQSARASLDFYKLQPSDNFLFTATDKRNSAYSGRYSSRNLRIAAREIKDYASDLPLALTLGTVAKESTIGKKPNATPVKSNSIISSIDK